MSFAADILAVTPPWEPFAWAAAGLFALGAVWRWHGTVEFERYLSTLGWIALALLWLVMAPYFMFDARSPIQSVLVVAAIPASLWAGRIRWRGRDSLFLISKAAAIAGLVYLPAHTIEPVRRWLIEMVAAQTHWLMEHLGHSPGLAPDPAVGYMSLFAFDGHTTYIVLACTGIGSIAIFSGAIFSVGGPIGRRLGATVLIAAIIYGLNLIRNVFVGLATPLGWFDAPIFVQIAGWFGVEAVRTSFFISHTLIAQPLSLVALIGLTLLALRLVPELFAIFDEVIYIVTGDDVDLQSEVGPKLFGTTDSVELEAAD